MRLPVPVASTLLLVSLAALLPAVYAQTPPAAVGASTAQAAPVETAALSPFKEQVTAHYATWDADKNRELSQGELDAACADYKITGPEAAALAAIKRASRAKTSALVLPVSLDKLNEMASVAVPKSGSPVTATTPPNVNRFFGEASAKISKTKRSLFSSDCPPRLDAVRQGKLGDCFCLAPLGAMLARDPQEVAKRFHADPKDPEKYEVTIGTHVIPVMLPTDAEIALSATARNNGVWVNLYEKAVGICRNEAKPVEKRTVSPYDDVTRGGSAGTMLSLLTAHKIERFSCTWAKKSNVPQTERDEKLKTLRTELTTTQKANLLMTCGTNKTKTPSITPNHAYAILGYDEKTDALKLWNPHGDNFTPKGEPGKTTGYVRKDGVFSIPINDFVDIFSGAAFERAEPAPAEK